jgi:hypothetical protein
MKQTLLSGRRCLLAFATCCATTVAVVAHINNGPTATKLKIVLVGDSTVTDSTGWGLGFKQFLTEGAECINTAQGGRSSESFRREGRWTNALALKGDYYLIHYETNAATEIRYKGTGVIVLGDDFRADKITFENTSGDHGQALSLRVDGDRAVFNTCRILGWQDTLMINNGRQYFTNCYVEGRVD